MVTLPSQETPSRQERLKEHRAMAAWELGVARGFDDLADYLAEFKPGNDPARESQERALKMLRFAAHMKRKEGNDRQNRADILQRLVDSDARAEARTTSVSERGDNDTRTETRGHDGSRHTEAGNADADEGADAWDAEETVGLPD